MKIRWGRILTAALLCEAILTTLFLLGPIITGRFGRQAYLVFEWIYAFAVAFLVTMWLVRKIDEHVVLHGVLVGTVKQLIFFGLFIATGRLSSLAGFIAGRGAVSFWLGQGAAILATTLGALVSEKTRPVRGKGSVQAT